MTNTAQANFQDVLESKYYTVQSDDTVAPDGVFQVRRLQVRKGLHLLQLEVTRFSDDDVTGYIGSVSNPLNDNDITYDDIDGMGLTIEGCLLNLANQL